MDRQRQCLIQELHINDLLTYVLTLLVTYPPKISRQGFLKYVLLANIHSPVLITK